MVRVLLSVTFSILMAGTAHADQVGESHGTQEQTTAKAAKAKPAEAGEYGEDFDQVASNGSVNAMIKRTTHGVSWRNTQVILMGMDKIRCRKGGINAKTAAIPALAEEGYCNQKDKAKRADQYPKGTVWVYTNGRHGNTVVKVGEGKFYDNRLMSAPPSAHGTLAAIMVPGCGKKVKKCGTVDMAGLKALEKASDEAKSKRAESMERNTSDVEADAQSNDTIMTPSPQRLEAEESCGYANAFRAPEEFNSCVEDKLNQ